MKLLDDVQAFLRKIVPKPIQQVAEFIRYVFVTVVNTVLLLAVYLVGITFTYAWVRLAKVDLGFGKGDGKTRWTDFEKVKSKRSYYRQF